MRLGPASERRTELAAAAAAALATLLVFSAAPPARFLAWDDAANLLENDRWRGLGWGSLRWMWSTRHYGPWQPLSWLSWAVDESLWGLDPGAFRRTNVALHAACAALMLLVSRRLLRAALPRASRGCVLLGALGAALAFSLHPLRVESVLWISERRDALSGAFALGSVLAWLAQRRALSAALLAGALLSKGTAVAVLPFLLAVELAVRRRASGSALWALGWHAALAAGAALMNLRGFQTGELRAPAVELVDRALLAGAGAWFYLAKTLWPAGLSPYYALPLDLAQTRAGLALSACAALAVTVAVLHCRVRAWALPIWLAYLAALAPVSGLLQNGRQAAADRYSYLAALPFAVLAGAGLARFAERRPAAARATLVCAALLLAALTARQSRFWADDVSLWSRAAALDPGAYLPRSNLAQALLAAGKGDEAAAHFQAAIELEPRDAEARVNLGTILESRGERAGAERLYRAALALKPDSVSAAVNLAGARAVAGDREEAAALLERVVEAAPSHAPARFNLGLLLLAQGRRQEGLAQLRQALRLDPSLARRLRRGP